MSNKLGALAIPFMLATSCVQAADYKLEFSVSGFQAPGPGIGPAPFDSAALSLVFSAAAPRSDWTALKDFSLQIGNVSYSLGDVGYQNLTTSTNIQSNLNPGSGPLYGTNDFTFDLFHDEQFVYLFYTSVTAPGVWGVAELPVTITEMTASAVPEVQTYAMLLAGLGLMGALARRRKAQVIDS